MLTAVRASTLYILITRNFEANMPTQACLSELICLLFHCHTRIILFFFFHHTLGKPLPPPEAETFKQRLVKIKQVRDHKIMEWFGLKVTFKDHLVQLLFHGQGLLSLDEVPQSPIQFVLEHSHGASTNSLGNQFQCFLTPTIKNFFIIFNLNLPSFRLKPLPFVLPLYSPIKCLSHLSYN